MDPSGIRVADLDLEELSSAGDSAHEFHGSGRDPDCFGYCSQRGVSGASRFGVLDHSDYERAVVGPADECPGGARSNMDLEFHRCTFAYRDRSQRDTRHVGLRWRKNRKSSEASPELHGGPADRGADQPVISPEGLGAFPISSVSGLSPSAIGVFPLDVDPALSTPLDDDTQSEEAIPTALWWAMKDRKHHHRLLEPTEPGYLRSGLDDGDSGLYFVDDGGDHCMVGRLVGSSSDGCEYCLVARVQSYRYDELRDEALPVSDAFSGGRDICLCCVFKDDRTSDVTVVEHYRHAADIPPEYLPPSPLIEFTDSATSD